nr:methyltransferase domain-containing protein [Pararhodobacter sp. SW119]
MDWEDFARPWLDVADELEVAHRPVLTALMEAARLEPGEHVLDVGCGTGPVLQAALRAVGQGGRVTGIDIAPPLLARAAERLSGTVELSNGDAGSMGPEP